MIRSTPFVRRLAAIAVATVIPFVATAGSAHAWTIKPLTTTTVTASDHLSSDFDDVGVRSSWG